MTAWHTHLVRLCPAQVSARDSTHARSICTSYAIFATFDHIRVFCSRSRLLLTFASGVRRSDLRTTAKGLYKLVSKKWVTICTRR